MSSSPRTYDVAIIGAGPGGSVLATLLARRGLSTLLVERDAFPRDKLCGEFLSYDAAPLVERLGADLSGATRIDSCSIVGRHRRYEFPFPRPARGISRLRLDDLLVRIAIASGATLVRASAISAAREIVETDAGEVRARVVAGAWGRWSRFDTQLEREFVTDRSHRSFGFKRHYRGEAAEAIELYAFRKGYLGVNAIEGGLTNICGLVHASRLSGMRGRWDGFVDQLRSEEPQLERLFAAYEPAQDGFLSSDPVIFRPRSAVESGIFMVGDASGVIDPLTGSGMAMAIQSAVLAAPSIAGIVAQPRNREPFETEYRTRHAAAFRSRIRWSRSIAMLLSRPTLLEAALRSRPPAALGRVILQRTRGDLDRYLRHLDDWFA